MTLKAKDYMQDDDVEQLTFFQSSADDSQQPTKGTTVTGDNFVSRHTVVCCVAQEADVPLWHQNNNAIFTYT